jgi:hypothetical protein
MANALLSALEAAIGRTASSIASQIRQTPQFRKLGRLILLLGGGGLDFVFHKLLLKFCGWNTRVLFPRQALVLRLFKPGQDRF